MTLDLVQVLRASEVGSVRDFREQGRPGPFTPVGIIVHHTAMKADGLNTCRNGRPDLPGPLCHLNINRKAQVNVVTDGRANHGGEGSSVVLGDVKAGRAVTKDARARGLHDDGCDGNRWYYGIEVDNDGLGEPYSPQVLAAVQYSAAAILHALGRPATAVIHHRQHTSRKIDMSWRGPLTSMIAARMKDLQKAA